MHTCDIRLLLCGLYFLDELFSELIFDSFFPFDWCYGIATWQFSYQTANGIKIWEGNMLQWFPCTDATLLPSTPQSQLVCLNNQGKLGAPWCLWRDCFWPHCFLRGCPLPHCCSVGNGSVFWHWLVWSLALACQQLAIETAFPSLYKVCSTAGLLIWNVEVPQFWSLNFLHQARNNLSYLIARTKFDYCLL